MWRRYEICLCVCSILLLINIVSCQEVLLEISQGILRGRTATNQDGGLFYSFQNIPYAQPPINELRFKAPVPADGWEDIRDATTDVPNCWQFAGGFFEGSGQEDCLYLNVYTPELPSENSTGKPVMVWIHGGAFAYGSAGTLYYGPEFLLTKDIVLVAMNYRLGLLGFINLDDPELGVPGNAGMKDQVLALQWVKDNIQRFGGDPNDVTIIGESAGAMSVHLHVLSQMSTGLFQKASALSGAALSDFLLGYKNNGVLVAQQLGIQTENWSEMLTSLQEMSVPELISAAQILYSQGALFIMSPTIEGASNEPAFLSSRPLDIIRSGDYNQVALLTGVTNAEGLYFILDETIGNILEENFSFVVPREFEVESGSEKEAEIAQKIKEFYFGDTEPSREDIEQAVALYTDIVFGYPAYRSVLEHWETLSAPMYFYIFAAETELNFNKQVDPRLWEFPGAAHSDDLGYLFHTLFTPSVMETGSIEDLAWRNMVALWTNFAIYGNPTPDDSNGFVWPAVGENEFNFVNITTNVTYSDVNPNQERMQFWYNLYEEYF